MGNRFKYQELQDAADQMLAECEEWEKVLQNIQGSISTFHNTDKIEGGGADSMKNYFSTVYNHSTISALKQAIAAHKRNTINYVFAFKEKDLDGKTCVDEDDLDKIVKNLEQPVSPLDTLQVQTRSIKAEAQAVKSAKLTLNSSVMRRVRTAREQTITQIEDIKNDIADIESESSP